MYSKLWHPSAPLYNRKFTGGSKHYSRTERPIKYFYIDFGLSRKYEPTDESPRELPVFGGDKSVPEFQRDGYEVPADPFRTDIYCLGNLIRLTFLNVSFRYFRCASLTCIGMQHYRGFEFVEQLVADMVQDDPQKRPAIAEVETRVNEICRRLSWWKLRARLVHKDETVLDRAVLGTLHIFRTAKFVAKRRPPVPIPS